MSRTQVAQGASQSGRVNLLGMTLSALEAFFAAMGERSFRARQVMHWIYQRGVGDFAAMTDLSRSLRATLADTAEIRPPLATRQELSADGTCKWLFAVEGGNEVETVLIPEVGRNTLCVSSQAGCALDCSFCATGRQGFSRNLTGAEIIGQLWHVANAQVEPRAPGRRHITNVVMMGMGEPLLNFGPVVDAMKIMMEDHAYGISKRRVTLSTSGYVPGIDALGEISDVSLAISLHAPEDGLRDQLVPINRRYPIAELLAATRRYLDRCGDKRIATIEYTLLRGVNDSPAQARQLAALLAGLPCKINLIPFNPFAGSHYCTPTRDEMLAFQQVLQRADYVVTRRTPRGDDIGAACGQLVGRVRDRTRRSARYQGQRIAAGLL